jgi:acetolactate synthase-1/2/3 large subunit
MNQLTKLILKNINFKHINVINIKNFSNYKGFTGGQIIEKKLNEKGVRHTFIYSGGAIMPVIDTLYKSNIKYTINTHEQSLGHSATGYAKSSGKPGICIVTSGPGLTNLITPMLDAHNDSTPLIVFSGNVPLKVIGTQAFQECPATEMTKPFTKWSVVVKDIHKLPHIIDKAWDIATSGKPGCVHIDLPKCILTNTYTNKNDLNYETKLVKKKINKINYYTLSHLINKSKKPIIIVGKGCNKYPNELYKFVSLSNIPVTSTIHGVGIFPENSPLSLKMLGMHGSPVANYSISEADLIINLGSRFDDRITGNVEKYAPEAYRAFNEHRGGIIHVNIETSEFNKNIKSHYNYNMDCGDFLKNITPFMFYNKRYQWIHQINKWKQEHYFKYIKPDKHKLNTQMVIEMINNYLDSCKKWKITTGVGNHQMWASQFITYKNPNSLITSGSLGVMGAGLGYAIGTQIANPDYLVINIDGDGSFNHTLSELKTISNYNLPIKIAIMNDGQMSMVRTWEKLFFDERYVATDLSGNPDYCKLAKSFGIRSIRCSSINNLEECVNDFLSYKGPILCDFRTVSEMCYPLVAPGKALDDMILFENHNDIKFNSSDIPS